MKHFLTFLIACSLVTTVCPAFAPPNGKGGGGGETPPPELPIFTIEYLGTLGGTWSMTYGMNDNGDVTGIFTVNNVWHSFLWIDGDPGGYQDLGTLAGLRTLAESISDRDVYGDVMIAGYGDTSDGTRAWRYDSATFEMQSLGVLNTKVGPGGSPGSYGLDINFLGSIVGWSSAGRGKWHAFQDSVLGGMRDLGTLGGNVSSGNGNNDAGDVVGESTTADGFYTAFVYKNGIGMFTLEPQTVGLDTTRILDGRLIPWRINASGQICGPGENSFNFSGIHGEAYLISPILP